METSVVQIRRTARRGAWRETLTRWSAWVAANRDLVGTAISGLCLALSLGGWFPRRFGFDPAWGAILISGVPLVNYAIRGLFFRRDLTAGVLVSIALIGAVAIKEYFAAGEVAFIMAIGEILENRTVAKAGGALRRLASLVPPTASVVRDGEETRVLTSELRVGELILVRPGENIPADGVVRRGESTVNQAAVTGESLPVEKGPGDEVFVGTTNVLGALEIEARQVGEATSLAKVIELVRRAQAEKAPIVRLADQWAAWLVPASLIAAVVVGLVTKDVRRAVTILVVFCPCALVLATPTAIMAGIGNAAKRGILIKSGAVCEQVSRVDTVVFDKTGTLTLGRPEVAEVAGFLGVTPRETLRVAGAVEQFSEHPLARAVLNRANADGVVVETVESFQAAPGRGATALLGGQEVGVGNLAFLKSEGLALDPVAELWLREQEANGRTALFVTLAGRVIGGIAVADQARPEAAEAIAALRAHGVAHVEMLTGDSQGPAAAVAAKLGLTGYSAGQLPADKEHAVRRLKGQGRVVAMVGDGINDAPALAAADVGIAMGLAGTDVAVETAGIALMTEDLRKIPELILVSRRVMRVIAQNLWASALINLAAIILASGGWMGPVLGALWHNAGSVAVVANSARLLRWQTTASSSPR